MDVKQVLKLATLVCMGTIVIAGMVWSEEVGKNMLQNSSFDDIDQEGAQNWMVNGSAPLNTEVVEEAENVHSGMRAIKLSLKEGTKEGAYYSRLGYPISPKVKYEISIWAKGKGKLILSLYHYIKSEDGKEDDKFLTSPTVTYEKISDGGYGYYTLSENEWKNYRFSYVLNTVETGVNTARFAIALQGEGGYAYVDDCLFGELK